MYKQAKRGVARKITNRNTRKQQKYVFKTDVKIGKKKYGKSPYLIRTQLWAKSLVDTPFSENIFNFKTKISPIYKAYLDTE